MIIIIVVLGMLGAIGGLGGLVGAQFTADPFWLGVSGWASTCAAALIVKALQDL